MPHTELVGPPAPIAPPAAPKRSVLSRVADLSNVFFTNRDLSEIQQGRSQAEITANQATLGRQQIEANQAATQQQQETQRLVGIVQQGNAEQSRQAADRLFQLNPELVDTLFKNMGATSSAQREDASRRANEILQTAPEGREAVILRQAETLRAEGRDPRDTLSLIGQSPEDQDRALNILQSAALSTKERLGLQRGTAEPFALRTFRGLAEDAGIDEEELAEAARIQLGLDPRAVGSGEQTVAQNEELLELVAEMRETLAERTKFAERTGASRASTIDKGFASIGNINKNIRNIDRAITALEGGASTGAIESRFFPSIRESSVILDQIQGELALDVVGSVTFGALSKGELDLARSTALPTSLQPPELIAFLQEKRSAQEKLGAYYDSQIQHLDQGGTIASFLQQQRDGQAEDTQPVEGISELDPALLEFMTPEERALFEQ